MGGFRESGRKVTNFTNKLLIYPAKHGFDGIHEIVKGYLQRMVDLKTSRTHHMDNTWKYGQYLGLVFPISLVKTEVWQCGSQ